jgi:hypothetical protein
MNPHLQDFYSELEQAKEKGLLEHESRVVMHFSSTRSFYEDFTANEPLPVKYAVEIRIQIKTLTTPEIHNNLATYLHTKYQLEFVRIKDALIAQLVASKEDLQRLPTSVSKYISVGNR